MLAFRKGAGRSVPFLATLRAESLQARRFLTAATLKPSLRGDRLAAPPFRSQNGTITSVSFGAGRRRSAAVPHRGLSAAADAKPAPEAGAKDSKETAAVPAASDSKAPAEAVVTEDGIVKEEPDASHTALVPAEQAKPSLWQRTKTKVIAELKHYWIGSKLLAAEFRISWALLKQMLAGESLSRRERRQLLRSTADLFRLIPFAVIVIVPFMEFTLPVLIKIFPNMLPSTFDDKTKKEMMRKAKLKVKIEMAHFLQETTTLMTTQLIQQRSAIAAAKSKDALSVDEFNAIIYKIKHGIRVQNDEIIKYSRFFQDDLTMESLNRQQLVAMCRLLDVATWYTTPGLRRAIMRKVKDLREDDRMIQAEGVESMTLPELQEACRSRGINPERPVDVLQRKMRDWLELSLKHEIPVSLLVLSRSFSSAMRAPGAAPAPAAAGAQPAVAAPTLAAAAAAAAEEPATVVQAEAKAAAAAAEAEAESEAAAPALKDTLGHLPEVLVDDAKAQIKDVEITKDRTKELEAKLQVLQDEARLIEEEKAERKKAKEAAKAKQAADAAAGAAPAPADTPAAAAAEPVVAAPAAAAPAEVPAPAVAAAAAAAAADAKAAEPEAPASPLLKKPAVEVPIAELLEDLKEVKEEVEDNKEDLQKLQEDLAKTAEKKAADKDKAKTHPAPSPAPAAAPATAAEPAAAAVAEPAAAPAAAPAAPAAAPAVDAAAAAEAKEAEESEEEEVAEDATQVNKLNEQVGRILREIEEEVQKEVVEEEKEKEKSKSAAPVQQQPAAGAAAAAPASTAGPTDKPAKSA